jgi:3-hydroxyisobutyrate dehydrogenase
MKIGFIGLGTMGARIAANLQKAGYKLIVNDVQKDSAKCHLAAGAEWAETPYEVAKQSEVVFTSLPGPLEVEEVVFGKYGLLKGAHAGMAYFDFSTNSPTMIHRVHAAMKECGAQAFDAPVSGGPKGAETAKLAIWVGGDQLTYDKYKKVLEAIGDQIAYIGDVGTATVAKLVHNLAGYGIQTVMAEVFTMGVKAGMDPLELWKAIRQGTLGRRRMFDRIPDQFLVNKYDPPAFALKLAHKDVTLAVGLGRELGVPMRLSNLVLEEMTETLNRGWGNRDSRVTMVLQQERAGVTIACDPDAVQAVLDSDKCS